MAWHGREKEQLSCIHFIRFNLMICEWRIFLWAEFLIRHSRAKIENWMLSFTYCVLLLWNDWSFQRKQKFLARLIKSPLYVHFRAGINWFITFFIRFCIYCSASNFTVMYEIIMMIDGIFYEMTKKKKLFVCSLLYKSLGISGSQAYSIVKKIFLVTCTQIIMAIYHIAVNRCLQYIIVKQDLSIALSLRWNFLFQQISIAIYFLFTFNSWEI